MDDNRVRLEDARHVLRLSFVEPIMLEHLNPATVGKFLNSNPTFLRQWIRTNVSRQVLETWLQERAVSHSSSTQQQQQSIPQQHPMQQQTPQLSDPSLQKRAKDNHADYITEGLFSEIVVGRRQSVAPTRQYLETRRNELLSMNEKDLFMELVRDISYELDVNLLCYKILWNVCILTRGDRASMFLVRGTKDDKYLVSKLFDVSETSSLYQSLHTEENMIVVPFGKGIAGTVALKKETINIRDAYKDPRFNKEVDTQTGYRTKSILSMPVLNSEGDVIGVAEIMNKSNGTEAFNIHDEALFKEFLIFCGIGLTNAQLFEMSVNQYMHNQLLLNLAKGIFLEQTNLEKMVERILVEIAGLTQCQRYIIYLVSKESAEDIYITQAFDMNEERDNEIIQPNEADITKSRLAMIARDVARTKELRILDTHKDAWYQGKPLIDHDGFNIVNVLTVPVINFEKNVVGVVQMINKFLGSAFNGMDVNSVETFAIYCGHGIYNCKMYEDMMQLMAKQKVDLEVLSYHVVANVEETQRLMNSKIQDPSYYRLYEWDFTDQAMDDLETAKAAVCIFQEMGIQKRFSIPYETLCRWIMSVKKNYRPVQYHNWRHGLNVAQTMFAMLFTGYLKVYMDEIERCALVVACLCHDLDHRGTNNSFQLKNEHPLATLYSTSTLEHHHFDHCVFILNSEGNNIFANLSSDAYKRIIQFIEQAILATDLALFFVKRSNFENLVNDKKTNWKHVQFRNLLRDMMMTACDLAAISKPWEVQLKVAELVSIEFFEQGDLERKKLGLEPIAIMDRRKKDELPRMQVGFIETICIPLFKGLASIEPRLEPLYVGCLRNREIWAEKSEISFITAADDDPVEFAKAPDTGAIQSRTKYRVPVNYDRSTEQSGHSLEKPEADDLSQGPKPWGPRKAPKKKRLRSSRKFYRRLSCCIQ